ncbi:hypothetical protein QQA44_07285 [Sneathia vaginalis]|uniref:hypothetical protein n=1 Tax=Sneathia vaginalis TaxID=187101 RepID=UPI00254CF5E6|nr:hypothetical protein [Sneathia vaginalis]MDK9582595.1 hypothetical protein [Sneathia vaginalis]
MKKTLLLTSLVASMVAMAGTTGSVKSYAESEAKFETKNLFQMIKKSRNKYNKEL